MAEVAEVISILSEQAIADGGKGLPPKDTRGAAPVFPGLAQKMRRTVIRSRMERNRGVNLDWFTLRGKRRVIFVL